MIAPFVCGLLLSWFPAIGSDGCCKVERRVPVGFKASLPEEELEVSVQGRSWRTAALEVIVRRGGGGEVLYQHRSPLSDHLIDAVSAKDWREGAERLVGRIAEGGLAETTCSLPAYTPRAELPESAYEEIVVPREQYERLRQVCRPVLRHPDGHETWLYVAWDEDVQKAVVIIRGGV